jgi:thiol:disulfide interchange protein DsbD
MRFRLVMFSCFLLACWHPAGAQKTAAKHAQLELLAQQSAAIPGRTLPLGVHFQLEKGWHIYWINPGDSGQPPVFQWQLPPGFSAGDIQWPRPEKMQTAHLADYGYHDDVLLLVPLHAGKDLKSNSRVEIGLDAKWLICREVCIADRAHLHIALPVSSVVQSDPGTEQVFANARKQVPRPFPARWKARAESHKKTFVLVVETDTAIVSSNPTSIRPPPAVDFFPLQADQIENAAVQVVVLGDTRVEITLQKSDQLIKPISLLKGVLVLPGGLPYRIEAPVIDREMPTGKRRTGEAPAAKTNPE